MTLYSFVQLMWSVCAMSVVFFCQFLVVPRGGALSKQGGLCAVPFYSSPLVKQSLREYFCCGRCELTQSPNVLNALWRHDQSVPDSKSGRVQRYPLPIPPENTVFDETARLRGEARVLRLTLPPVSTVSIRHDKSTRKYRGNELTKCIESREAFRLWLRIARRYSKRSNGLTSRVAALTRRAKLKEKKLWKQQTVTQPESIVRRVNVCLTSSRWGECVFYIHKTYTI